MQSIKTIGIIGGRGVMGQFFQKFFQEKNYKVIISDIKTKLSNKKVAETSDLLIFSVPIDKTVQIIKSVTPYIKPNKVLFDLTSLKKEPLEAMLQTKAKEVIGGHPMFRPTSNIQGQIFALCPGRGREGFNFLKKLFEQSGAQIKKITASKHDQLMTIIQGFTHFTDITLARALAKTGVNFNELLELQSPAYRLKLIMMGRILAQDANLYGNIQVSNPNNAKYLETLMEANQEMFDIIKAKDLKKFTTYFNNSAKYLKSFTKTAIKESDFLIEEFFQQDKKSLFSDEKEKTEIGLLGPKNTYSDFASEEIFPKAKSKKYCKTIKEVFENVTKGKIKFGIVPVENNLGGPVHETYDCFWQTKNIITSFEHDMPINHVLVSLQKNNIKNIKTIYSHSQALSQCSDFLEKNRHIQKTAVSSTGEAIARLKSTNAAIIPEKAATKLGLPILAKNIMNSKKNFTRFYVIHKKSQNITPAIFKTLTGKTPLKNPKTVRTALAFELLKTKSGSLLKILQFFAEQKINLLKLESKPVGNQGDTIFFVDTDGGVTNQQIKNLKKEVAILKVFGQTKKVIGQKK